jgi:hypothetical protein
MASVKTAKNPTASTNGSTRIIRYMMRLENFANFIQRILLCKRLIQLSDDEVILTTLVKISNNIFYVKVLQLERSLMLYSNLFSWEKLEEKKNLTIFLIIIIHY